MVLSKRPTRPEEQRCDSLSLAAAMRLDPGLRVALPPRGVVLVRGSRNECITLVAIAVLFLTFVKLISD